MAEVLALVTTGDGETQGTRALVHSTEGDAHKPHYSDSAGVVSRIFGSHCL